MFVLKGKTTLLYVYYCFITYFGLLDNFLFYFDPVDKVCHIKYLF